LRVDGVVDGVVDLWGLQVGGGAVTWVVDDWCADV
jgi:hypothetical protein